MSDSLVLNGVFSALAALDQDVDDATRIDRIRLLEELKSAAAAAQARETAAFASSQRRAQAAAGVKPERIGRGVGAQVALALRTSPFRAQRYVGWASILTSELPATFAELAAGRTTEWRAMLVARETAWLSREHRVMVDRELASRLHELGDRRVEAETQRVAYRLDPAGAVAKVRGAESDRRVTLRPAPDTMARLTGLLPVAQGVAAYAALNRDADTMCAAGDSRSRGQVMADLLVQRITGQVTAADVPVEVTLVMTPDTLLRADSHSNGDVIGDRIGTNGDSSNGDGSNGDSSDGGDEPAWLEGYGPIPAGLARDLITNASDSTPLWIRRVFTTPRGRELAAMETRRRYFTTGQRRFLQLRDQFCRTPWCGAPIRHADHVVPAAEGGVTSISNSQGLCQACNHAKQAPGWLTCPTAVGMVETITPTGHRYQSRPPDLPGCRPRQRIRTDDWTVRRRSNGPSRRDRPIVIDYDWHTAA